MGIRAAPAIQTCAISSPIDTAYTIAPATMALAPHLATSLGATSDASTKPTLHGAKMPPAVRGSSPSPVCTNKVKHKKNELDVEYTRNTSSAPSAK
ncbi:hypothetical protein D3C79_996770 [compost metagenome]